MTSYDESVGFRLNHTTKRMVRFLNTTLERFDITLEQWVVLLKLSQQDQLNQKLLAAKVDKDQPTLVRILDILERKALVSRQARPEDRRSFAIHLTVKGRQLYTEIAPALEEAFQKMLVGISPEQIEFFTTILTQISNNIEQLHPEATSEHFAN